MSKNITLYSLEKIKKEAKKRKLIDSSITHSKYLDLISIEKYNVPFRDVQKICHNKINSYFEKNEYSDITICSLCSYNYESIEELNKKEHHDVHLKYEKENHKYLFSKKEHIAIQKSSVSRLGIRNSFNPIILNSSEVAVPVETIQGYRTTVYYEDSNGVSTPFEGIKIYNKGGGNLIDLLFDEINHDYNKLVSELNAFNIECFPGHTINARY